MSQYNKYFTELILSSFDIQEKILVVFIRVSSNYAICFNMDLVLKKMGMSNPE